MFPTIYDQFKKLKKSDVKINKKNFFDDSCGIWR